MLRTFVGLPKWLLIRLGVRIHGFIAAAGHFNEDLSFDLDLFHDFLGLWVLHLFKCLA